MNKEKIYNVLYIGLPAAAIAVASGEKSVRILDRTAGVETYQSYFDLLPESCFQISTILAMGLAMFALIFGIVYVIKKDPKWFKSIYLLTFASVFAAEIPTLMQSQLLVLPNIFVPILLVADCAIAYSQMKKPQKEEKKQTPANRLQPRR